MRRTARDPAEKRFLHFLDHYSQRHRPDRPVSRAQTQPHRVIVTDASDARIDRGLRHTSQPSLPSAQKRPTSGAPVSPMTALLRRPSSALSRDSPGKITAIRQRVLSKIAIGIHVALLNAKISQKPGEIQLEEPMREATVEHVQRIYRQFLRFKALESDRAAEAQYLHQVKLVQEAWCENSGPQAAQDDSFSRNPWDSESENPLSRMRWATFIHWLEQEASCGIQQTYRRSVAALLRGVKLWRQMCASPEQAEGISLGLLLSWAFPSSSSANIAEMLSWLALNELESIRWPSPRLIDDEERKQLERIFHKVYAKGRAAITADDIAGGDFPDRQTQIMTLVDSRLARHVFGDKKIDWPTFLEHMCEMGCQGHPSVTRVRNPEGVCLARCRRTALNFHGWLSETPSEMEVERRKVVDALEAEVVAWRSGIGY